MGLLRLSIQLTSFKSQNTNTKVSFQNLAVLHKQSVTMYFENLTQSWPQTRLVDSDIIKIVTWRIQKDHMTNSYESHDLFTRFTRPIRIHITISASWLHTSLLEDYTGTLVESLCFCNERNDRRKNSSKIYDRSSSPYSTHENENPASLEMLTVCRSGENNILHKS